ncbi:FliH/SctL family protein [Sphingomonas lenta]|uniref:Flagellar assembly protein FliH/Type III secretion system HrpE domain-containing protein n=1 Tax=Sphingomonas lenta TaxID=1141887 RepID=A0A2A2SCK1_9SPHN|nr:FliH/SctL family protein [Sphingomonas lenta]PAX06987.1 hypothetical protein CKY28_13055 [Sphingomonas lenta]
MSFVVLHADRFATALADDPVVPAAQVARFRDALTLLAEAGRLREEASGSVDEAHAAGRAEGYEAGRLEGRAAGEEEMGGELLRLARQAAEEEPRRRAEIATLALEVVRRIAGAVGEEAMVAGLAERAVATVSPDVQAVVRVPPAAAAAVAARLGDRPALSVEADATLTGADCVIETPLGRTHAGLETQLRQIERIWREVADGG